MGKTRLDIKKKKKQHKTQTRLESQYFTVIQAYYYIIT